VLAIVGTVPDLSFPVAAGKAELRGGTIRVAGRSAPVNRGTPALVAAAIRTLEVLGRPSPHVYLAGDIGLGEGSRRLYELLVHELPRPAGDCSCFTIFSRTWTGTTVSYSPYRRCHAAPC
jgi:ADP-dependent NAD(P)H-hydrate dehydratase / NAD(P)H-hydrate epimerase